VRWRYADGILETPERLSRNSPRETRQSARSWSPTGAWHLIPHIRANSFRFSNLGDTIVIWKPSRTANPRALAAPLYQRFRDMKADRVYRRGGNLAEVKSESFGFKSPASRA
jgi:hypothetical protein